MARDARARPRDGVPGRSRPRDGGPRTVGTAGRGPRTVPGRGPGVGTVKSCKVLARTVKSCNYLKGHNNGTLSNQGPVTHHYCAYVTTCYTVLHRATRCNTQLQGMLLLRVTRRCGLSGLSHHVTSCNFLVTTCYSVLHSGHRPPCNCVLHGGAGRRGAHTM